MKNKGYASFVISMFVLMVLAWSSPVASLADAVSARVALFANGSFVDLDASYQGEVLNVKAALEAKGYSVSLFSGISSADFTSVLMDADILYIPEFEIGSLGLSLSAEAQSVIADFVGAGGGLIINGSSGDNDEFFINTVFGFSLLRGLSGVSAMRSADAEGTYFAEGSSSLPANNGTYSWLKSSLPAGGLSLYENEPNTTVALLYHGSGKIIFLAYDWFNAIPRGSQDGGWDDILGRAVLEAAGPRDDLLIAPHESLSSLAYIGGPAIPSNTVYTLTNTGSTQMLWTASSPDEWIEVAPASGTLFPGATQAVTVAISPLVRTFPQGSYAGVVTFSNAVTGVQQSRHVELDITVRPPLRQEFKVLGLHASNAEIVDHNSLTGDDRGGIATGESIVLCTGDSSTALYQKENLTGGVRLGTIYDALVSDLQTGQIYSLANDTGLIERYSSGQITSLVLHDPVTGLATSDRVTLSTPIPLGSGSGIYAGYGTMLLHTGPNAYSINFASGEVENLGTKPAFSRRTQENWATWGIAEWFGGTNYFVYVKDTRTIARTAAVPGGETTVVSTFSDLGDMATITAAPDLGRWYFHHEYESEFGLGSEVMGFADATYYIGPADTLRVTGSGDYIADGWEGGPFTPSNAVYTLMNISSSNLTWTATHSAPWLSVSPAGGVLPADTSVEVTLTVSNAAALVPGSYADTITISNLSSGIVQSRDVDLTIHERVLHHFAIDPVPTNQLIRTPFDMIIHAEDETGWHFAEFSGQAYLTGERLVDGTERNMLNGLSHQTTASTATTRGHRFSVTEKMSVTHLLHYWGEKISIWTDDGTLVYSMEVDAPNGSWTEIELPSPLNLEGGRTYRIGAYGGSGSSTIYRRYDNTPRSFENGSILASCYATGDAFPSETYNSYTEMVDFTYYLSSPVEILPTNAVSFVDGRWTGSVSVLEVASNVVLRISDREGHSGKTEAFDVGYIGSLSLELPPALDENYESPVEGRVTVDVPWSEPLSIYLESDDESELIIPAVVSLPAGETSVSFALDLQDDEILDASRVVNVSAAASRYLPANASMLVHDSETAALSLSLPQTSYEGAGFITGALLVNQAPYEDVSVELISNNPGEIGSSIVVIPQGQTFVSFSLPVIDDEVFDGVQTATIEAHVENWQSSRASVFVFDDESSGISLELPALLTEGDGVITNGGMASIPAPAIADVNILLTVSDPSELSVPPYVTIPAGSIQAAFDVEVLDDADVDGTLSVSVLAQAPGYIPDSGSLAVVDNDPHHLSIQGPVGNLALFEQVSVTISARTIEGNPTTAFSETVSLSAEGDRGAVVVSPSSLTNFVDGVATISVSFGNVGDNVVLLADAGAVSGMSAPFNVLGSLVSVSPASLTNSLVVAGESAVQSLVISNAGNADLVFAVSSIASDEEIPSMPSEGLIAHYPFNGDSADNSGNGYDGSVVGATLMTNRFGEAERAYYFDGVDDRINLPTAVLNFERTNSFTQSFWLKSADADSANNMIAKMLGSGSARGLNTVLFNGILRVQLINYNLSGNKIQVEGTTWLSDNLWHHVTVTYDGSSTAAGITVYIDGKVETMTVVHDALTGTILNTATPTLGSRNSQYYYQGALDDIRIYDRVLSGEEIETLYAFDGGRLLPGLPWIVSDPPEGTIPPASNMTVSVTFDAADMTAGDHSNATLLVVCNDVFSPSNKVEASIWVLPPAPIMTKEPEVTVGTTNEVAWDPADGPVEYRVEVAEATNSPAVQQSGWIPTSHHTFTSLTTNTLYYYRAKASVSTSIGLLEGPWSGWIWSMQISATSDTDEDGIFDAWEIHHFGDLPSAGAETDYDKDGQSDVDEFISGMDPTNAVSYFSMYNAETTSNGYFVVYWDAVTGRVYTVHWKSAITNGFAPMATNLYYPQGSYTDQVHQSESCGFYRVEVEMGDSAPEEFSPPPPGDGGPLSHPPPL